MSLRAFVPAGWMPNPQAASNGVPIVICTLEGARMLLIGVDGKPLPAEDLPAKAGDHGLCPFASTGHAAPPTGSVELPVLTSWLAPLRAAAGSAPVTFLTGRIAAPRGPPTHS